MGAVESVFEITSADMCLGKKQQISYLPVTLKETSQGSTSIYTYGTASMQGWRLRNEDTHLSIPHLIEDDPTSPGLFGVMDGHGGKGVAHCAAKNLPGMIRRNTYFAEKDYETALRSAFLEMDAFLSTDEGRQEVATFDADETEHEMAIYQKEEGTHGIDLSGPDLQGCTCCIALVCPATATEPPRIICANLGDSRCIVGADRKCVALSEDHKPSCEEEEKRVVAAGGTLIRDVIGGTRINGGLNVSRAFGDFQYKMARGLKPHEQMISPMPEIRQYTWKEPEQPETSFLFLACDGIWDRHSNEDVLEFVSNRMGKKEITEMCSELCDITMCTPEQRQNGSFALKYTGQDNMTCVVLKPTSTFWPSSKQQSVLEEERLSTNLPAA